jgi:hypothetical protein
VNAYLDHLLDLVEPDGSYVREDGGVTETGFANVERAAMLALLVELRALRVTLEIATGQYDVAGEGRRERSTT